MTGRPQAFRVGVGVSQGRPVSRIGVAAVSSGAFDAFHRIFPRREFFRGRSLASVAWSLLGSLFLCALLFCGYLITDLLVSSGEVEVDTSDPQIVERLESLSGGQLVSETNAGDAVVDDLTNTGIFPTVWWARDRPLGPLLALLWREISLLRTNWAALATLSGAAVIFGLLRSICLSVARRQAERVALHTVTRVRRSLHRQSHRLGPSDLLDQAGDHVLQLFTREAEQVREAIALYVYRLGRHPLKLAMLLGLALLLSWRDAVICLVPLAACWFLAHKASRRREETKRLALDKGRSELRVLSEALRKTRMIRGYGMEEFEQAQFESHLARFQQNADRMAGDARWMRAMDRALLALCIALVAFLLGSRVLNAPEELSFAAAVLLAMIFACMYRPIELLWSFPRELREASLAATALYRYLDRTPEVAQAVGAKFLQPLTKTIRFDNVAYALPGGRKLLDGVDLQIRAREFVAVVSLDPLVAKALVNLLPRFIEPQRGRVLYDDEDTAWATLESLRAETVIAGADVGLTGSARDNIACGRKNVPLQQVTDAAKKAHAHHFIQRLSQGYETILGEHGEILDEGQAFRLGLARAAYVDPTVLIVEEPTARLDEDTKNLIDDAYQRIFPGRTVIVLPTRLSTVKKADRVIVLNQGRVEAVGRHSDLVRGSNYYRHWEYSRFNEFQPETA